MVSRKRVVILFIEIPSYSVVNGQEAKQNGDRWFVALEFEEWEGIDRVGVAGQEPAKNANCC